MTVVGGIFSAILGGNLREYIRDGIREIFLLLDGVIYSFISTVYRVFYLVADANLFDFNDPDSIGGITSRIYTVLGVVMLFVFAYNIIVLLSNPNKLDGDNSLTQLAKNTVISIVLITLLPTIFNYMHVIQHDILQSNVIGNIILSGSNLSRASDRERAGTSVAVTIFSTFFHPIDPDDNQHSAVSMTACAEDPSIGVCEDYNEAIADAMDRNDFRYFAHNETLDAEFKISDEHPEPGMEYLFIISTAAGCLALYMFLSFTIDAGIRVAKLSALQLIAPIPVILRITKPSGGIFSKWLDELISSYISVFVRLAIIFFSIFSIDVVTKSINLFPVSLDDNGKLIGAAANVVIVFGILQFAKDAPGLLEAIAGSKGSKIRLSIKDKLNENEYGKRAVSAVGTIGGNLGRMAFNTLTARDSNGNRLHSAKDFFANAGHQLLNLPTNVFRGGYEGWRNGNVDFSHGLREGVSNMRDAVDTSMETTRRVVNERQQRRKNTAQRMRDEIGFGVVIPGFSYWTDVLNERLNMGAADADQAGGFMNALSNSVNGVYNGQVAQAGHRLAEELRRPKMILDKEKKMVEAERDRALSINDNNANKRTLAIDEKLAAFDDEERHLTAETDVATSARNRVKSELTTYDSNITSFESEYSRRKTASDNVSRIQSEKALKEQRLTEMYDGLGSKKDIVDAANANYELNMKRAGKDEEKIKKAIEDYKTELKINGLGDYFDLKQGIMDDEKNITINNATIDDADTKIKNLESNLGTNLDTLVAQRQSKVTELDKYDANISSMQQRREALIKERADLSAKADEMKAQIEADRKAETAAIKKRYGKEVYERQYVKSGTADYKERARAFVANLKEEFADDLYMIGPDKIMETINEVRYKDGKLVWGEDIESLDDLLEKYVNPESAEDLEKINEFIGKLDKFDLRRDGFAEVGHYRPAEERRRRRRPPRGGDKK